jgi:hypothetical protein
MMPVKSDRERESNSGPTVPDTRANGAKTKPMAKEG